MESLSKLFLQSGAVIVLKGSSTDGKKASEMLKQPLGTDFKIGVGGHRELPWGPQPVLFMVACRSHHGAERMEQEQLVVLCLITFDQRRSFYDTL